MEKLKFRAFVKSLNKVLDVIEIRFLANEVGVGTRHDWHYHDVKDCVLMQYTGLKDKNGVEIYELDYVLDKYNQRVLVKYEFSLLVRLKEIEKEIGLDGNYYE